MKRIVLALAAVLALVLVSSCAMPEENTSLEGTWVGESALRTLTYTFNGDGTFNYVLRDRKTGDKVTEINGTWEYGHEGYLNMYAPITIYESRYTEDNPRFVFIKADDPDNKLIYFGGSGSGDPYDTDVSLYREYETDGEGTYTYADSMEYDDHGVITATVSARRFKFEDGNKCTLTTEDRTEFENGTYTKSTKGYTYYAEDPYDDFGFICYRIYNEKMEYEAEELTYTIIGKSLALGRMSQIFTKQ